jgi:pyruvate/oxaloacetate carboxyltransferase
MSRLGLTDTTLRDAHQSLLATRLRLEDMLPAVEMLDAVGFHSLEVWGGATFDTCLRFLGEDPWERLRLLRKGFKKSKLQMLLRGQNLVGYKHYPDDVVTEFVRRSAGDGIDIFRVFDALNDVRNMETAIRAAKDAGAHVQGTVSYTVSPIHDAGSFTETAKALAELGADSICVKDMAGILTPYDAEAIVRRLKEAVGLPVQLHCHYTSGMGSMAYLKAAEAGVDVVDTAISTMALGTSQPPTESLVAALAGTARDTGLDLELLARVAEFFREVRKKYAGVDVGTTVDVNVIRYQIPGGMYSNFISQLEQQKALDRLPEVLAELPRLRREMGYPPLVTPSSQIVGSQAVLNVLAGERFKLVSNETKAYMRGLYGLPPGEVDAAVRRKVIGDETPVTVRPADLLPPGLQEARREAAPLAESAQDVLSYALFPAQAGKFLEERLAARTGVDQRVLAQTAAESERGKVYPAP